MTDPITYNRIVLKFQSPWNLDDSVYHIWQNKFNLSGGSTLSDGDAEATGISLAQPILKLASPNTHLVGVVYYPPESKVAQLDTTYESGEHPGTHGAYTNPGSGPPQQLEVCAVVSSKCGINERGKAVYLRKYCHDVLAEQGAPNQLLAVADQPSLLDPWNNGAGPHRLVPVRPTTGAQGDFWSLDLHLFTRQLRRGHKRKKGTSTASEVLDVAEKLVGLALALK